MHYCLQTTQFVLLV